MSEFVASKLSDSYFDVPKASARYKNLLQFFASKYDGAKPDFIARSPGRVNIIGDHIDYSYFPCLPAAISFDMVMAVRVIPGEAGKKSVVKSANVDDRFPAEEFEAKPNVEIHGNSWVNYFRCSWDTGIRYLTEQGHIDANTPLPGLEIVVCGNVPAGGGSSSSAAFVVSGTSATLRSVMGAEVPINRYSLTKLSATCEQLVGVNSGGMDQAASVFGRKDYALLVYFRPDLIAQPLKFADREDPLVFLIANSLVVSAKLETAPTRYNSRVVEVTVAANILAKKSGNSQIAQDGNLHAGTLYGVMEEQCGGSSCDALRTMLELINTYLNPQGYTSEEAAKALDMTVDQFKAKFMSEFPVEFTKLKLYERTKHVYEETSRVMYFVDAIRQGESPYALGDLMNASQLSAQTLYENSHPDCDLLCHIATKAGAYGSRVTGAGWGGFTVHLVARSNAEQVRKALQTEFYDVKHPNAPKDALIETRPSSGTALFEYINEDLFA